MHRIGQLATSSRIFTGTIPRPDRKVPAKSSLAVLRSLENSSHKHRPLPSDIHQSLEEAMAKFHHLNIGACPTLRRTSRTSSEKRSPPFRRLSSTTLKR
ncbi:unnamed protein product, partial [Ectocarpus sp. 8 AP-2014]